MLTLILSVLAVWAALAAPFFLFPLLYLRNQFTGVVSLALLYPFFLVTVAIDLCFKDRNPFLSFPRNEREIRADPLAFFNLLAGSSYSGIPAGAKFLGLGSAGSIDAEPGKARSAMKLRVRYAVPGGPVEEHIDIFVKVPAERGVTLWIKTLGSVWSVEPREVGVPLLGGRLPLPAGRFCCYLCHSVAPFASSAVQGALGVAPISPLWHFVRGWFGSAFDLSLCVCACKRG